MSNEDRMKELKIKILMKKCDRMRRQCARCQKEIIYLFTKHVIRDLNRNTKYDDIDTEIETLYKAREYAIESINALYDERVGQLNLQRK